MGNKKVQLERKKTYFIEATKSLIEETGVEALTVKKIAHKAGYATGTLYNYFDSLNVLLFNCILDYFEELYNTLSEVQLAKEDYEKYLLQLMAVYTDYFTQKPEIYYLIYLKNLGSVESINDGKIFRPKITKLLNKALIEYFDSKKVLIKNEELEIIGGLITNSLHGNLLFYINKKSNISVEELKQKIKLEVTYIIKRGEKE
ncbi:MAG TPA: TetR/AcrR family transcriptional regulator [Clostridia bacterium]|nr:TetR/AcrR family transcriptional regulator [Clostridia bacterium]